jgi:hypothetical protein
MIARLWAPLRRWDASQRAPCSVRLVRRPGAGGEQFAWSSFSPVHQHLSVFLKEN